MRKTDGELLAAISKKDKTAYTQFFNQYCRLLYVKVVGMTRDTTDAEDILQNFWLKLWNEGVIYLDAIKTGQLEVTSYNIFASKQWIISGNKRVK